MQRSIKKKLLASHLGIIITTALIFGILSFISLTSSLRESLSNRLTTAARVAAFHTEKHLLAKMAAVEQLADSRIMQDYLKTYRDLALAAHFAKHGDTFADISFIGKTGVEEVRTKDGKTSAELRDMSKNHLFQEAKKSSPTVHIADHIPEKTATDNLFHFALPLHAYFGDAFQGVLFAASRIESLAGELQIPFIGDNIAILAFDAAGIIRIYPDATKVLSPAPRDLLALAAHGSGLREQEITLFGAEWHVAMASEPTLGWTVAAAYPHDLYAATIKNAAILFLLLLAAASGIGAGVAYLLAQSLSTPLMTLTESVKKISGGDAGTKITATTRDEVGELVHSFNAMVDELKQTTISRDHQNAILDSLQEAVLVANANGIIMTANSFAASMFGYRQEDFPGMPVSDLFAGREIPRPEGKGPGDQTESECRAKDGRRLPARISAAPLIDRHGANGTVYAIIDTSRNRQEEEERGKLQAQLFQAQKLETVGTLAGGVAHDFNNILTAIIGFAQLSRRLAGDKDPTAPYLQQILEASQRAKDLVRQLLSFSRRTPQTKMPLRLDSEIKEIVKLLRASTPSTIEIRQRVAHDCRLVTADPTMIHQIVMNLCTNSVHAMEDHGGTLTISLVNVLLSGQEASAMGTAPGDYVKLSVSDTGCGIAPGLQPRIFDPFFTTKEIDKGTGLGLSVVHGIVKEMNGVITLESEVGTGTTFHVYIPAVSSAGEKNAPPATPASLRRGAERILVVDDEPSISTMIALSLAPLGYRVTACQSSEEALEIFQKDPKSIDLVITDQTMPKMCGSDLARKMMEIRPDLPIILATGQSAAFTPEAARAMGMKGFLTKPFGIDGLCAAIGKALAS